MFKRFSPRFVPTVTIGLALLAAASALAAGCGGDDAKPAATQPPAPTVAATVAATATAAPVAQVIQLAAVEDGDKYTFSPPALTAKAGAVTIHYTNKAGNVRQHGFELKTLDGSGDVYKSALVDSGSTGDFVFTVPGPGTYQFLCFQRGHADRGQAGTIVVTAQ